MLLLLFKIPISFMFSYLIICFHFPISYLSMDSEATSSALHSVLAVAVGHAILVA